MMFLPLDADAWGFLDDAFGWISGNSVLAPILYGAMGVALAGGVLSLFVRR